MYIRLDGAVKRDLQAFTYPPLNDLKALGYCDLYVLGHILNGMLKSSHRLLWMS